MKTENVVPTANVGTKGAALLTRHTLGRFVHFNTDALQVHEGCITHAGLQLLRCGECEGPIRTEEDA